MGAQCFHHKVTQDILELIESGAFPIGSRLPSERDLAKEFGVSRVAVRKAEKVLQAQGRLKVKTGSGVYVLNHLGFKIEPFELTEARALFEAECAALAAPIITDETISILENLIEIMSGNEKSEMTPEEADTAFHKAIARATNNQVIMFITDSLWKMRASDPQLKKVYKKICDQDRNCLGDEHNLILDALKKRDSAAARKAMRAHFSRRIEALLSSSEEEAYREINRTISEKRSRFLLTAELN